jgi:hypothetical protein
MVVAGFLGKTQVEGVWCLCCVRHSSHPYSCTGAQAVIRFSGQTQTFTEIPK